MEEVKYSGKIIEVVQEKHGNKVFETARRSPGVRALIIGDSKMLLSREWRNETKNYDFRLPGGKIFDTLEEFRKHSNSDMVKFALDAVIKEVYEEVGLDAIKPKFIKISCAGATIKWDLYYFVIEEFSRNPRGQELEEGEDISYDWYTFDQVKQFCLDGQIQEDRSVAVILTYLLK